MVNTYSRRRLLLASSAALAIATLSACSDSPQSFKGIDITGADYATGFSLTDHNGQNPRPDLSPDIINNSWGGSDDQTFYADIIQAWNAAGIFEAFAAGNDGGPVAWPGRHTLAMAVSALGVRGSWPRDATQSEEVERPFGRLFSGEPCFVARFSNRGAEIDLAAPGLGIVSTMPPEDLGVMDGTSMACPIATGLLAARLAKRPSILAQSHDAARADEIERLALTDNLDLELPRDLQGHGMPR